MTVYTSGQRSIELVEVGPRDGLQNEARVVCTSKKVELIKRLLAGGVRRIEVASFVHPAIVPQMADAEAVVEKLPDFPEVSYIGLVLNRRGALRALETKVHELGAVCMSTDAFGLKNQGQTSSESVSEAIEILRLARSNGRRAQVTISAAWGCPFEGEVSSIRVVEMAKRVAEAQPIDVALADTIGVACPQEVFDLIAKVKEAIAPIPIRAHFHNTRNTGIANLWSAIQAGVSSIDSSVGGLGGCPFAPNATGNVPTEDVVYMLNRSFVRTGVDLEIVTETAKWMSKVMGRQLPGMLSRIGDNHCAV